MKIKGIDLYKRVLEEDETILGKIFEFDGMKIQVVNTFGSLSNEWGLAEYETACGFSIFYNPSTRQIDAIFKAEWVEVRQAVSFMEAVRAFREGKAIYCEWDNDTYYYRDRDSHLEEDETGYPISSDEILEGKWYIED